MKGRALAVNLAVAAATVLVLFLAAEAGLRFVFLRQLNPFTPDPEIGYRLKTDFDGVYPRVWVRTDSAGRRVPQDQERDAGGELLFIGDSVTFGFGVAAEDSFPYVVGRALGEPEQVADAAVPGYNLAQSLVLLRENVARERPRLVIFGLVVNDIPGADRAATYEDIDPAAARANRGGFLSWSAFAAFIDRRLRRIEARFDPPPEATTTLADVRDFDAEMTPEAVAAFDAQWRQLEQAQLRLGVPVYVLICPFRQQVEGTSGDAFQRFAARRCSGGPLVCLDPLGVMRAAGGTLFNGASSYHYNPRGHRILGTWLAERIGR